MSFLKKIGRALKKAVSWITGIKEPDVNDFQQGSLINKQSNVEPIPVIYGERRVGGVRVFVASSGTNNEYLYMAIVLCEGEIEAITDILIDDKPTTDPKFAYTDSIAINTYFGTDGQIADPLLTGISGWGANHRLRGLAYLAVRLKWNQDAFNGIPNITAVVRGKKCYDPRTTTTIYTQNPAICLRDYLINARYGKGLASALIDDASFIAAANKCDAAVSKYTGAVGTEPIFEFNAIINTGETLFNNVKVFLASMRGIFPFSDGKYSLVIEDDYSPTFAFTIDNILSDINVTSIPKSQQYNRVTAKFTNPAANWQSDSVSWPLAGSTEAGDFLIEDNGVELVGEINIPGTTDVYSARDLARIVCLDSRLAKLSVDFTSTTDALSCSIGDVVTLTHPSMGWTTKRFRVTDMLLADTGEVSVGLKEHVPAIYPWVTASEAAAFAASTLPNPLNVAAPTSFVIVESASLSKDGTVIREIDLSWTPAVDAFVERYEIQFKLSSATEYFSFLTVEPRFIASYGDVGETYNVRVRAINGIDVRSAFLTATYTTVGDTTAPAIPTGVTITGDYNQVTATWSAATERDYKESWVYQNTTGTTPLVGDTPFRKVTGNTVTVAGLAVSTTYYVWVRNVDFSGNVSGFSSAGTFTTTAGASIADGTVTTAKIVDSAVVAAKIGTNAVTEDKINALAVVAAKIASGAVETAKIADLAVSSGKLADLAATEAKIAANAITTTKINDLAISTPKLAAGAVTAAKITAGTITANEIAASTITGAKIAAGTITASNIAALTITANEIAANAITAGKILAGEITGDKISATFTTTSNLVLTTAGKLYTDGKTSAASTTAGVFLGHDGGSNYDFAVGDGTKSIVWDGSASSFTITNVNLSTNGQLISTGSVASAGGNGAVVGAPTNTGVLGVVGVATSTHTVAALGGYSTSTNSNAVGVLGQTTVNGIAALQGIAGGGDAGGVAAKLFGNVVVGEATNTGIFNLVLKEGTVGSRLDNQMQIYGALSTDADTTLGLVTEQGVVSGTGAFAGILQIRILWNGTEYWLPLQAV